MAIQHNNLNEQFRGAVHREAVSEQITERVLSLIREKQLKPGDRLPPERELSATMGVSRATLRESLRSLEMMNIVELRHGSGTYVTSLEPGLLVERFDLVFSLNDNSFLNLIEARQVIEPGATALAARRATDEEIAALDDVLARSWDCLDNNPADFPTLDIEFHTGIAEYSHNALLTRIMQSVAQLGIASSRRTATREGGKVSVAGVERAINAHQSIVDAIRSRDAELARLRMYEHLIAVEQTLRGEWDER
ncbi:MAG: FadR family transcriptional regulator [Anaerolineae bacterium]|jgi:GntR family transcriptional repressor for pyruvate dehydrogenase complex|nr:FadR family transcriptional regulator [Anaerolineae bacterium]